MKKQFLLFFSIFSSILAFSQGDCYTIDFSYDASGNRIQRALHVFTCGGGEFGISGGGSTQDTLEAMKIKVYPNPAQDKITIELTALDSVKESKISLYDINGRIMYSTDTPLEYLQIDVSNFSSGNYYLEVVRGKKRAGFNVSKN